MMSEDLFFNKVKETMHGYSPEVSADVYGAMRKKYARSKFFSWNASTLNVWYVALVAVMGSVVFSAFPTSDMRATKASSINTNIEHLPTMVEEANIFVAAETKACEQSETVLKYYKGEPCIFPSSVVEAKSETPIIQEIKAGSESVEVIGTEEVEVTVPTEVVPAEEEKVEATPKKSTRKIKAPIYKDKQ
jgi:hypothetical protein